ncbi:MAG: hypothetical protein ACXW4C_02045 [Nitrospira sp.]
MSQMQPALRGDESARDARRRVWSAWRYGKSAQSIASRTGAESHKLLALLVEARGSSPTIRTLNLKVEKSTLVASP